jgi:hypothetical protein
VSFHHYHLKEKHLQSKHTMSFIIGFNLRIYRRSKTLVTLSEINQPLLVFFHLYTKVRDFLRVLVPDPSFSNINHLRFQKNNPPFSQLLLFAFCVCYFPPVAFFLRPFFTVTVDSHSSVFSLVPPLRLINSDANVLTCGVDPR